MKALLLVIFTLLANSPVRANSIAAPPTDTGIELRIKECKPHPSKADCNLITVEITNTSKVDYWVRRRNGPEEDLLFSEANPRNYAYVLDDERRRVFREGSKWLPFGFDKPNLGGLLEKLEPGKNIVFQIPIETTIFKDPKSVKVALFFAREPIEPFRAFYLFFDPGEEKQSVPTNGDKPPN